MFLCATWEEIERKQEAEYPRLDWTARLHGICKRVFAYLRIPDEFLNTVDQTVSPPGPFGSQPECGMMTMLIRTMSASSTMCRFRS